MDSYTFFYQEFNSASDYSITAQITNIAGGVNSVAKAGIRISDTLLSDSTSLTLVSTLTAGIQVMTGILVFCLC